MVVTIDKKELKNAIEIVAKVVSVTGRIREYDLVYIGVDSSKTDGIFVIGQGSGGAICVDLSASKRENVVLSDGELIEFRAKEFLDELKTYDTKDIVFTLVKSECKQSNENDMLLYFGKFTEYTECFKARVIQNNFVFSNNNAECICVPSDKFTAALKSTLLFTQAPGAQFTDEYWACGVNLSVLDDIATLKVTNRYILAHADLKCRAQGGDDFGVTLKPGALNILAKNTIDKKDTNAIVIISPGAENEPCVIKYRNYTLSVPKINQRYKYGKELIPTVWDYSITLPKSEFMDALKGFIKDCGKEHGAYFKLKAYANYIAFEDTKGLGFKYGVAGKKQSGKTGFEIGFNAPMLLSVLKAIQWSGDEVEFMVQLNKDKKYACAGASFTNPNDENEDVKACWYVCEVMLGAGE